MLPLLEINSPQSPIQSPTSSFCYKIHLAVCGTLSKQSTCFVPDVVGSSRFRDALCMCVWGSPGC